MSNAERAPEMSDEACRGAEMITGKQIRLIHIAKQQLGLSDAEYRELLGAPPYFANSCKQLSADEADEFLALLKNRGFKVQRSPRARTAATGEPMATPKQIGLILHLWQTGARSPEQSSLRHFLAARFGVSDVRFLPLKQASACIEALKRISGEAGRGE